ncbi:MAG: aspartate carbamoyltransferase regulatory subunit [Clostridiaceae bacterium]
MRIDSIINGTVIDHIPAGKAMRLYRLLNLDTLDRSVAIMINVVSDKMAKKDIIKIDGLIELDTNILGFVAPHVTVNIIRDEKIVEKKHIDLPECLTNVLKCKNPRCITSVEQELPQIFRLTESEQKIYRCIYCEASAVE